MKHYELNEQLIYLFGNGEYYRAYETFGAHPAGPAVSAGWEGGTRFTVWAPGVRSVRVLGEWQDWGEQTSPKLMTDGDGIWTGVVPEARPGMLYKYMITDSQGNHVYKADPFALSSEVRPGTASRISNLDYEWTDAEWMKERVRFDHLRRPLNIYEVHPGSWRQHPHPKKDVDCQETDCKDFYTYTELKDTLIPYVKHMGYTHIEFLPLMEHPFDGSWGYQTTGYFSATSRYGAPAELKDFINACHREGIGVILDWVPGHFCRDSHGLVAWNGDKLYESEEHPNWGTFKFNFASGYVRSFLLSSAMFWLDEYHADGLRVDGVSSMLYLNFGIDNPKQKRFNCNGGEENLEAVSFLQDLNRMVGKYLPGVITIAEESTAWPMVTAPPEAGGLGFNYKWDMGWMNDTLHYMQTDFPFRSGNHHKLTFSMMYNYSENFILPLSHDEVVHGKCSLIGRMPGDYWREFAGLRFLALYQMTHPGAKLNFMGNEIAQFIEWRFYDGLEWFLLDYDTHASHQQYIKDLNHLYLSEKSLWDADHMPEGYMWLDADNTRQCVYSYIRKTLSGKSSIVTVMNAEVNPIPGFRIGVPAPGVYQEIFSSDNPEYGGSGQLNKEPLTAERIPMHGQKYSIEITVPPLGGAVFKKINR